MEQRRLSRIPGPHVRYFAAHPRERRKVIARIGRFTGHGLHFHVTMREEPDRVWAPDLERWEVPLDDPTPGRERMMKFRTREKADRWIESTFRREFSSDTHELVREVDEHQWTYAEGE
jgi:hypothetical protein